MITVVEDPRIGGYCAMRGDLAYFVTVDRSGVIVPAGGPPDAIPADIARAVAAFVLEQCLEGATKH
ncbi:hypothetical protein [Lichenifustis flavocetrariae]|uniref:Uncharacterized protein n=1 Tax=Lichenifustis flavocetrariae TaxID=2949735 RepID=A0AA42CGZ7_9HYPH|nr:hypothetical protein [Lichenifustis flavocetrariae]MCW6507068.1 hypothetical protein [Lichenifustis flavocetrariae]